MKRGQLKSIGHNIADSLASGIGLMIGVYDTDVFAEAAAEAEGFVVVDFLAGTATGANISEGLRGAIRRYKDELPVLCAKHGVDSKLIARLETRYGTDPVYGRHFTVLVEDTAGRRSSDRFVGVPGRRLRRRR
jgi:hypothetical protein